MKTLITVITKSTYFIPENEVLELPLTIHPGTQASDVNYALLLHGNGEREYRDTHNRILLVTELNLTETKLQTSNYIRIW